RRRAERRPRARGAHGPPRRRRADLLRGRPDPRPAGPLRHGLHARRRRGEHLRAAHAARVRPRRLHQRHRLRRPRPRHRRRAHDQRQAVRDPRPPALAEPHARHRARLPAVAQGRALARRAGPRHGARDGVAMSAEARGLAWIGLGSTLIGVLDLGAQMIILHFFLTPAEFGIAALATALVPLLDQATDLGLSSAVIQRDDHSPEKIAAVFWLSVLMSALLFGVIAVAGPIYARWQGYPVIGAMLLAYGGKLLFQNAYMIPFAMMRRELRFKEVSLIRIVANVVEAGAKVAFAAAGLGAWCFVLAALLRAAAVGIGVQLRHPWRPRFAFRLREASAYARFGATASASQLLFYFYTNADYPVVSKLFGATALGLY